MAGHLATSDAFLVCRSGTRLCALPLENVVETMRPLPVNPIPTMPPFLMGVAIIRGAVSPVVNVARLVDDTSDTLPTRFVTLKLGTHTVAFAVDDVLGIRALNADLVEGIPLLLHAVENSNVAAITVLDAELLLVLQSARVIPEDVWETLDSEVLQS
jgi:purine-binding chemotaxis protein CheW